MKNIVIDLGGTKLRCAVVEKASIVQESVKDLHSSEYESFEHALASYAEQLPSQTGFYGLAVGVAGPVTNTAAEVTNLGWEFNTKDLKEKFSFLGLEKVRFLNDLEAVAWGVPHLSSVDVVPVLHGEKTKGYNMAVVAAGTGLGMAALYCDPAGSYHPFAAEGGHTTFAPTEEDSALSEFLRSQYPGHVSFERVVSGKFGFYNLFMAYRGEFPESKGKFEGTNPEEFGAKIYELAVSGDPLSIKVIDRFLYYYGSVAGNFALMQNARSGVFLGGGIAPKLVEFILKGESFKAGFTTKGRFSQFNSKIPVSLISNELCPLLGLDSCLRA